METTENNEKLELRALQNEQDLLNLFEQPGWQLIREHIERQIDSLMERLTSEKSHEEIIRMQADIRALRTVPQCIREVMQVADQIRELRLEEQKFVPDLNT